MVPGILLKDIYISKGYAAKKEKKGNQGRERAEGNDQGKKG